MDNKALAGVLAASLIALLGWNIKTTNDLQLQVQRLEIILLDDAFAKMTCLIFIVGFGHSFYDGFYKSCTYKCPDNKTKYYRVHPEYICPRKIPLK